MQNGWESRYKVLICRVSHNLRRRIWNHALSITGLGGEQGGDDLFLMHVGGEDLYVELCRVG